MIEESNQPEWQAPPPPEKIIFAESAQMSEIQTLGGIFFEPGKTFEDLRRKPRFIMALLITVLLTTAFSFAFYYKVGEAGFRKFTIDQMDKSPQAQNLTPEQKQNGIGISLMFQNIIRFALPVIFLIVAAIGGLIYWLAAKAFGGTGNYLHGISVWVYSSLPPTIVSTVANFIVLAFKDVDNIDIATDQRGLVHANPGILLDGKTMPVLTTMVSILDVFLIWGWILAAIGLQKTNKISSGTAWTITLILAFIGIVFRLIVAYFSGNPS